jgi:hypothetical protein
VKTFAANTTPYSCLRPLCYYGRQLRRYDVLGMDHRRRMGSTTSVILAASLAMVAAVAIGSPSAALEGDGVSSTPSWTEGTATPMRNIVPEVDERQCNVGERPRQIVLNLGIGGEEGQRCFGGSIGTTYIGRASVYSVFTGDYKGAIDCHNRLHHFEPTRSSTRSTSAST